VAEVTDGKQEWEIHDIIGKEVVEGKVLYMLQYRMPRHHRACNLACTASGRPCDLAER
jgi:hypothetical protein